VLLGLFIPSGQKFIFISSLPGSGEKTILIVIISCGGFKSSSIDGLIGKKGRRAVSDQKTGVFGVLAVKKLGAAQAHFL
jgi:hypothetical protein